MSCLCCGAETNNPKYCSLRCATKMQPRIKKDKTRVCPSCGTKFDYGRDAAKKFCTHSCAAAFNNRTRTAKNHKKPKNCPVCSTETTNKKFCSPRCSSNYKSSLVVDSWKEDPSSATTTSGLSQTIRKYLISEAEHRCSSCGWGEVNPITGRSPLEVDHINGDCHDNRPENLRVLCPNCHALTPTYKALNKNSKRSYR